MAKALHDEAVGYGELADKIEQLNEGKEESAQGEQAKSRKRESSNCDREPNKRSKVDTKPLPSTGTQQVVNNDGVIEPQDLQQQQYEQLQAELQQTKRDYQKRVNDRMTIFKDYKLKRRVYRSS